MSASYAVKSLIRSLLITGLLAVLASGAARAQLYEAWHRPIGVEYRQVRNTHFRLIYQTGLHDEAVATASLLRQSLPELRALVGLHRELHLPVVLNRFTDRSNGFVTALPFRQEIEAVRLRGKSLSPRFSSWLEKVAPHELAHAVHAESGHGFGIGWMLRRFGPDLARALNFAGPKGINEGLAVWYESRFRQGAGRLNYSLFQMEFRAAMLSDDPWSLAQMLEDPSYTFPYDRFYHGGAYLFRYMEDCTGSIEFFRRARNFFYRFPLLGYGPALWYGTRIMPHVLGRRLRRTYRRKARRFVENLGELSDPTIIASRRGDVHRSPVWVNDSTLIVYARGYHRRPGFYRVDAESGREEVIAYTSITEDYAFSLTPDSSGILYARYVPDIFEPIRSLADIFRLDVETGEATRLTRDARLFAPVPAGDGRIWALRTTRESGGLVSIDDMGNVVSLHTLGQATLLAVRPSPDGSDVAVLINQDGRQTVARVNRQNDRWHLKPWIGFPKASVFDISWSSDGRYLMFAADPGGVSNIYAWDRITDRTVKLTSVPFGAIEPSLSPDGSTLAFVTYRHERYDLARMPFDPEAAEVVPRRMMIGGATTSFLTSDGTDSYLTAGADTTRPEPFGTPTEYRPLLNLRPRVVYPFLQYRLPSDDEDDTNLGLGVGAGLEWSDPLQYWTAHTMAFYQKGTFWGRFRLTSGKYMLRPFAQVFREPSTVVVRIANASGAVDTVRVGRDEYGFGAGIRIPAVLSSNVFQTRIRAGMTGEVRRERLFGREGETLRSADGRLTVGPSLNLVHRLQANPRDIVPNSGLSLTSFSRFDAWAESGRPSRFVQVRAKLFLPFFRGSSTGLALQGSLHSQSRGGIVDLTSFFPRGYETEPSFLGAGTYTKLGVELTQPIWYIDDGFILLPFYFRALFAYGFVESMGSAGGGGDSGRRTVAGGGLGLQLRLAHHLDVTLRAAGVYRFREDDWNVTFR